MKELGLDMGFLISSNQKKSKNCKSDLNQDLFVLEQMNYKKEGFFVEFGACNGVDFSNTYLLETEYEWKGILAEPSKIWHTDLLKNRKCSIDKRCVWSRSGETIVFNQTDEPMISTIEQFSYSDFHAEARKTGNRYSVETISLMDLLTTYDAPRVIDYLSIDTEGSEYEILKAFDFGEYEIRAITCEHNFSSEREKIFNLLSSNGYIRKMQCVSGTDDWYILNRK